MAGQGTDQLVRQTINVEVMPQPSIRQLARAGEFRAIACWLNVPLVPLGIFARVTADRPGYLLVLLEFADLPDRDRLNRFVCYRLAQLQSKLIRGVRIITRYLGSHQVVWDQSIRLHHPKPRRAKWTPAKTALASTAPAILMSTVPRLSQISMSPRSRKLLMGGAAAAFVLGCSLEVANKQILSGENFNTAELSIPPSAGIETSGPITLAFSGSTSLVHREPSEPAASPSPLVSQSSPGEQAADVESWLPPDSSSADSQTSTPSAAPEAANLTPVQLSSALAANHPIELPAVKSAEGIAIANTSTIATRSDPDGFSQKLDALGQAGVHSIGAGRNEFEARRPEVVDVQGKRVAYLGYTNADAPIAGFWQAGVNPALSDRITKDIQAIRSKVDWVVVSYHWTKELASIPSSEQTTLARLAIDQGADLVVGYHPQVLQGAEIYKGRAIAYSLGDFVLPAQSKATSADYDTAMLKVALKDDQMRLEFLPVEVKQGNPAIAKGEKAQAILGYLRKASALFEKPVESGVVLDRQAPDTPDTTQKGSTTPEAGDSFVAPAKPLSTGSSPAGFPEPSTVSAPTSEETTVKEESPVKEHSETEADLPSPDTTKSLDEAPPSPDFPDSSFTSQPDTPLQPEQAPPEAQEDSSSIPAAEANDLSQ